MRHERLGTRGRQPGEVDPPGLRPPRGPPGLSQLAQPRQRRCATMRDARRLVGTAEPQHGMERERAAQPLGPHHDDLEVERLPRRRPLLLLADRENGAEVSLGRGVHFELLVVAQLAGAAEQRRPVVEQRRELLGRRAGQLGLEGRRKQQMRPEPRPPGDPLVDCGLLQELRHRVERQVVDDTPVDELVYGVGCRHELPGLPRAKDRGKGTAGEQSVEQGDSRAVGNQLLLTENLEAALGQIRGRRQETDSARLEEEVERDLRRLQTSEAGHAGNAGDAFDDMLRDQERERLRAQDLVLDAAAVEPFLQVFAQQPVDVVGAAVADRLHQCLELERTDVEQPL